MEFRDLHRQYAAMQDELNVALLTVAASGPYILGEQVSLLERQLADYVGVKHCISCANGTDALVLALMALGIGRGDAVFVPDFTFFASAEAVAIVGAVPIFVDVEPDTFNIDIEDLEAKYNLLFRHATISPKAVIAVDLFGRPANYEALSPWCKLHSLWLVEDGAQGFGGAIGQRKACSFGDISTTSFFPAKPLGCYGDGGALFTDNDEYANLLHSLRVHGKGEDKYDNVRLGMNSRLDAMQAAVLLVKMKHFDDELKSVRRAAAMYNDLLSGKLALPVPDGHYVSSWAQYTVQCPDREATKRKLSDNGIPSMVYYPRTMSMQTAFSYLNQSPCKTAYDLTQTVLSLPIHPYITDDEIYQIASKI